MSGRSYISFRRLSHFWDKAKEYIANKISEAIQPAGDKEVISVLTYSNEEPSSPAEGNRYINSSNNKLYYYTTEWEEETPSDEFIYISADTSHIYLWNGSTFIDTTDQIVDNTIYVRDTTTGLASYVTSGIYNVVQQLPGLAPYFYTLIVRSYYTVRGRIRTHVVKQVLSNNDGYFTRAKYGDEEWTDWEASYYVFEKNFITEEQIDNLFE